MSNNHTINCPIKGITEIPTYDLGEITPLLEHLQSNNSVTEQTTFPRGTVMPDGRLDLCKQGIGVSGCALITQALLDNTKIKSLLLGTDGIGNQGAADVARLIEHNQHLEVVYLGCNAIEDTGVAQLATALNKNTSVKGLWLKRNPIGVNGGHHIAQMLRHNRTIRTLDLVSTQIGFDGLAAVIEVLIDDNRTVERLYLGGNQIDCNGAMLIAELIRKNPAIKAILLNVNNLGDRGTAILADALCDNRTLSQLGLASNGIGVDGGIALFAAMAKHSTLTNLDLGYSPSTKVLLAESNQIGDRGAKAVGDYLANNCMLQVLNLQGNGITELGKEYLIAGLEKNTNLWRLLLDGKQDRQVTALLERNQRLNSSMNLHLSDSELIRSVYRTVKH